MPPDITRSATFALRALTKFCENAQVSQQQLSTQQGYLDQIQLIVNNLNGTLRALHALSNQHQQSPQQLSVSSSRSIPSSIQSSRLSNYGDSINGRDSIDNNNNTSACSNGSVNDCNHNTLLSTQTSKRPDPYQSDPYGTHISLSNQLISACTDLTQVINSLHETTGQAQNAISTMSQSALQTKFTVEVMESTMVKLGHKFTTLEIRANILESKLIKEKNKNNRYYDDDSDDDDDDDDNDGEIDSDGDDEIDHTANIINIDDGEIQSTCGNISSAIADASGREQWNNGAQSGNYSSSMITDPDYHSMLSSSSHRLSPLVIFEQNRQRLQRSVMNNPGSCLYKKDPHRQQGSNNNNDNNNNNNNNHNNNNNTDQNNGQLPDNIHDNNNQIINSTINTTHSTNNKTLSATRTNQIDRNQLVHLGDLMHTANHNTINNIIITNPNTNNNTTTLSPQGHIEARNSIRPRHGSVSSLRSLGTIYSQSDDDSNHDNDDHTHIIDLIEVIMNTQGELSETAKRQQILQRKMKPISNRNVFSNSDNTLSNSDNILSTTHLSNSLSINTPNGLINTSTHLTPMKSFTNDLIASQPRFNGIDMVFFNQLDEFNLKYKEYRTVLLGQNQTQNNYHYPNMLNHQNDQQIISLEQQPVPNPLPTLSHLAKSPQIQYQPLSINQTGPTHHFNRLRTEFEHLYATNVSNLLSWLGEISQYQSHANQQCMLMVELSRDIACREHAILEREALLERDLSLANALKCDLEALSVTKTILSRLGQSFVSYGADEADSIISIRITFAPLGKSVVLAMNVGSGIWHNFWGPQGVFEEDLHNDYNAGRIPPSSDQSVNLFIEVEEMGEVQVGGKEALFSLKTLTLSHLFINTPRPVRFGTSNHDRCIFSPLECLQQCGSPQYRSKSRHYPDDRGYKYTHEMRVWWAYPKPVDDDPENDVKSSPTRIITPNGSCITTTTTSATDCGEDVDESNH